MPGFSFPGGIESAHFSDTEVFDGTSTGDVDVQVPRNSIAKEGTDIPDPEKLTAALADDREVRMGLNQSGSLRLANLPTTDFDTLEGAADDGTELFVKIDSMAKDSAGDPKWSVVYRNVILNHVAHSPVSADRSSYGVVMVDWMCTGFSTADIYSITQGAA